MVDAFSEEGLAYWAQRDPAVRALLDEATVYDGFIANHPSTAGASSALLHGEVLGSWMLRLPLPGSI